MRTRFGTVGTALVALALGGVLTAAIQTAFAQAPQPAAGYKAPRSKNGDGKPDLNGIWQAMNTANWDILSHSQQQGPMYQLGAMFFVPPGRGIVEGDELPYKPEAAARRKQNFEERIKAEAFKNEIGDPELKCFMPGVPRATYMPYPFQILQGHREILIAYQFGKANRVIHMNQKKESTVDSWMGISSGKWDGDTLVVDVEGLNGLAWLDRSGNYISEAARVQERYTPISPYHLRYEATITDPQTFTRPWKMSMTLYRAIDQGAEMLELNCVEFSEEAMYGALRMREK
jgi:hypothetical protein